MGYQDSRASWSVARPRARGSTGIGGPTAPPSHASITSAAFFYWEEHGGEAVCNWLLCERELSNADADARGRECVGIGGFGYAG
jgi:hypothetical protein